NLALMRAAVGPRRAVVVNFARWELGFATAPGNPLGIRNGTDLGRPGLSIANRESGAGARAFLDETLLAAGLKSEQIQGYEREFGGHLEVAAAVAAAQADLGVTIRLAADAYGLAFIPLREERYDLVMLESEYDAPPVKAMLDALNSRRFAREISQFCSYDTGGMGTVVARIP
ncbi:MAG: substrate-binding domain-containing protein, partial [Candidatus Binataceae bacterium]